MNRTWWATLRFMQPRVWVVPALVLLGAAALQSGKTSASSLLPGPAYERSGLGQYQCWAIRWWLHAVPAACPPPSRSAVGYRTRGSPRDRLGACLQTLVDVLRPPRCSAPSLSTSSARRIITTLFRRGTPPRYSSSRAYSAAFGARAAGLLVVAPAAAVAARLGRRRTALTRAGCVRRLAGGGSGARPRRC
jgi:hypothetical protein